MILTRQVRWLCAALSVLTPACGDSADEGKDPSGSTPDEVCPSGTVAMGGACIKLGTGAKPCENPTQTGFDGDSQCLEAPDPGEGMQMHYGPSTYDDPDEVENFTIRPGDELVDCMFMKTPNTEDIHFNDYHVRLRPGTHHMITYVQPNEMPDSAVPEACRQGASFTFLVGATAPNTDINVAGEAPEFVGSGMGIPAKSQAAVQMHFINTSDHDRLKEGWINMMFVDSADVKMEVNPITWLGGIGMSIAPHSHVVTQGGATAKTQVTKCEVTEEQGDLNIIATVAHAHSHTERVAAFIQRAGETERTKFYEDYNWEEPTFVYYNSATTNQTWDPVTKKTGGLSGRLIAHPGDQLSWECEVNNDSDNLTLRFSDLALTGEMCNIFGVFGPSTKPWSCISL